jgi:hypothetical protein
MKNFTAIILAAIIVFVSIIVLPACAYDEPSVGVKKGDWIEYTINITGPLLDSSRNLTWYRNDILEVDGGAGGSFKANMTALAVNGTISSSIWNFNLTEGQVQGWVIIPANLSVGDKFFDVAKSANVTIEGEEQKIIAGASRTVTQASDPGKLYKEWDKATGVYLNSIEHIKNYTIVTNIVATNMWTPQSKGQDQVMQYPLVAVIIAFTAMILSLVMVAARRKKIKKPTFGLSQGKIAALTILSVILAEVGFIVFFPFYAVGLSFAEINLVMQTIWTALVFLSLWFRLKGKYFVHEITMLIVMSAWLVGFSAVLFMDPLSSNPSILSSSPLRLVINSLHGVFSIPALVFGLWLVALWRPESISFAAKSKRIAQLIPFFWVASYVVGVLDFFVLHTTFFG